MKFTAWCFHEFCQLCSITNMEEMYVDNYRHKGLRKKLVSSIEAKGIDDPAVLKAINSVPRHLFFTDNVFLETAYEDKAFPIGEGQTISQPFTVAYQTQLLDVQPGMKVLEIGTGSGYQAAVLAEMGAKVFSIERQKKLHDRTGKLLPKIGYPQIKTFFGDGYKGIPAFAPYDRIIVTAAAPEMPDALLEQLKPGGIMVIPVGGQNVQKMYRITKLDTGEHEEEVFENFRFVPLLKGKEY